MSTSVHALTDHTLISLDENINLFRKPENTELTKELMVLMFSHFRRLNLYENRYYDIDKFLDFYVNNNFSELLSDSSGKFNKFKDATLAELMFACRRSFFTLINWLYAGKVKNVIRHSAFQNRLHYILNDRFGWAHLVGACRSFDEINQMKEVVREIHSNNPILAGMFDFDVILRVITDVENVMSTVIMQNYLKNDSNGDLFLATFFRQIYIRFFETARTSEFIFEQNVSRDDLIIQEQQSAVPEYIASKVHEIISLSDIPEGMLASKGYVKPLREYLKAIVHYSGCSTRNENTAFLQDISWIISHMGLSVMFDRTTPNGQIMTALDHAQNNIPGLQRETKYVVNSDTRDLKAYYANVLNPYATGNCWDQARIMTLYLALNGPRGESRTVLQVGNEYADHSYLIITKLSSYDINNLIRRNNGRLSMLQLFRVDQTAVIVDPWAKGLFREPILGLHYAEYPHNDTSQPRVPDYLQDIVTISSQATIGNLHTYQDISAYHTQYFMPELREILSDDQRKTRWTSFCLNIEAPYSIDHNAIESQLRTARRLTTMATRAVSPIDQVIPRIIVEDTEKTVDLESSENSIRVATGGR